VKHTITLTIECGETTCASKPGRFCPYMRTTNFGQRAVCVFPFPGEETPIKLFEDEPGGWIQRCDACKKATSA